MNFKELVNELGSIKNNKIVFVGLGNADRGDDGAGIELVSRFEQNKLLKGTICLVVSTTPENYLAKISAVNPEIVIFVDAVRMDESPGTIKEIDPEQVTSRGFSTHSYSIKLIEKFLRVEGINNFKYIGIEPQNTDFNQKLSAEVLSGIDQFFN